MKASLFILSAIAALAAASPLDTRQCAGCEPSGKEVSGSSSSANATNQNTNNISITVPGESGSDSGSSGGSSSSSSSTTTPSSDTDGEGETKGSCKACIDFCTGRGDLLDAVCKVIVCGIDCVVV